MNDIFRQKIVATPEVASSISRVLAAADEYGAKFREWGSYLDHDVRRRAAMIALEQAKSPDELVTAQQVHALINSPGEQEARDRAKAILSQEFIKVRQAMAAFYQAVGETLPAIGAEIRADEEDFLSRWGLPYSPTSLSRVFTELRASVAAAIEAYNNQGRSSELGLDPLASFRREWLM